MQEKTRDFTHPSNNFDFVRIVAATCVLIGHHFVFTGQGEPTFFSLHSLGTAAVLVFFSLSGYLVTKSWHTDPNVLRFAARRVLRIWPALTLVVVFVTLVVGPLVTIVPLREYFTHSVFLDYFNTFFLQVRYVLPGVFETNPHAWTVNGSLWTIPLEVRCYLVLAVLGLLGAMKRRSIFLLIAAAYFAWYVYKSSPDLRGAVHYGRELSTYFVAGAVWYCFEGSWKKRPLLYLALVLSAAAAMQLAGWRYTALLIALPYLVLWFGSASTPFLRRAGRWGDPSYGLYLFAFPIQQSVIFFAYPQMGFISTLLTAFASTVVIAYMSWHWVEKPALRLKPSHRAG